MTAHESLWRRLHASLGRGAGGTPAEVALRTGSPEVARFVWSYYYPHEWGDGTGAMTEVDARALVDEIAGAPPPVRPLFNEGEKEAPAAVAACFLCGKRRP